MVLAFISSIYTLNGMAASNPYIDPYLEKKAEYHEQLKKGCKQQKSKSVEDLFSCYKNIRKRIDNEIPDRGTDAYCKNKYNRKSKQDTQKLIVKLRALRDNARSSIHVSERVKGEVFEEDFDFEVLWLRKNILKEELMMYDDRGF